MSQESSQHRIETLRHQWRSDPTPRRSLELAEEYGRSGDLEEAIEVLRTGLEQHPGHVASRVALGRSLLEVGRPAEAREVLERIALEDQTHLVANKLLVTSHLELGEAREARDRLDLYTLLNESDADIESFEERLAALEGASEERSDIVETDSRETEVIPATLDEQVEEPRTSEEVDGAMLADLAESSPQAIGFRGGAGEPVVPDEVAPEAPVEVTPEPVPEPEPEPEPAQKPVIDTVSARSSDDDLFQDVWAGVERKSYWESLSSDGIFAVEPQTRVREEIVPPPAEPAEEPEAVPETEDEVSETEQKVVESTVTLGRLYLEQGHRTQAARVFREVLEREPGNRDALAGLSATEEEDGWTLTASDLVPAEVIHSASKNECRRQLLSAYLDRIKPAATGA